MMWNWLVSGLASGATLLLYDGSPFVRGRRATRNDPLRLRRRRRHDPLRHLGQVHRRHRQDRPPAAQTHRLDALRAMFSTGSPLAPESFDYVYRDIKADLLLASISGGTDIISCFALGNPMLPVWRGEIQCRGLGMAVDVFDDDGRRFRCAAKGRTGLHRALPGDADRLLERPRRRQVPRRLLRALPNVWCHGDFVRTHRARRLIIYGRSDARSTRAACASAPPRSTARSRNCPRSSNRW
jgi:acetoacetyl-CoA synthetase